MSDLTYTVEWRDGEHPGYFVTLDEIEILNEDSQWFGPFENHEAINDFVMSMLEDELVKIAEQSLNL